MTKAEQSRLTAWRLRVLQQAADDGNVARVCRRFGISRKSFYKWKRRPAEHGDIGLCDRARTPRCSPARDGARRRVTWSARSSTCGSLTTSEPAGLPRTCLASTRSRSRSPRCTHPDATRHASAPRESEAPTARETVAALPEAAARASVAGGRQVPGADSGHAPPPVSVHSHRRLHADPRPQDLRHLQSALGHAVH